jgi:hypothetical protein
MQSLNGPSDCITNCRSVLSSDMAPHTDKTATFRQEVIPGHKFQFGLDTKTYWLTDWPSVVNKLWLWQPVLKIKLWHSELLTSLGYRQKYFSRIICSAGVKLCIFWILYSFKHWTSSSVNYCWRSPAQAFLVASPTRHMTTFKCLMGLETCRHSLLKSEILPNSIYKFSLYLTGNTLSPLQRSVGYCLKK